MHEFYPWTNPIIPYQSRLKVLIRNSVKILAWLCKLIEAEWRIYASVNQTITWTAPSHYLNQCWNIVNSNLRNKLQWYLQRSSYFFIQGKAFENVVCEMVEILSRPQCVNWRDFIIDFSTFQMLRLMIWILDKESTDWQTPASIRYNCLIVVATCQINDMRWHARRMMDISHPCVLLWLVIDK